MSKRNVYVVVHDGKWAVRFEGVAQAYRLFDTQAEAEKFGRELARNNNLSFLFKAGTGNLSAEIVMEMTHSPQKIKNKANHIDLLF